MPLSSTLNSSSCILVLFFAVECTTGRRIIPFNDSQETYLLSLMATPTDVNFCTTASWHCQKRIWKRSGRWKLLWVFCKKRWKNVCVCVRSSFYQIYYNDVWCIMWLATVWSNMFCIASVTLSDSCFCPPPISACLCSFRNRSLSKKSCETTTTLITQHIVAK